MKNKNLPLTTKLNTVAGAMALSLLGFMSGAHAQTLKFDPVAINTFSITATGSGQSSTTFADLDGDGDLDMLSGSYALNAAANYYYYKNVGTATMPSYAAAIENPFTLIGINTDTINIVNPVFVDIDHDTDFDVVAGCTDGNFYVYRNTGTSTAPLFNPPLTNPYMLIGLGNRTNSTPAFADIDNDGDMDLISGKSDGNFYYFENTGTATAAVFAAVQTNPFSLAQVGGTLSAPAFYDFDTDGDMDLVSGNSTGDFYYYENTGTNIAPTFTAAVVNPFNLNSVNYNSTPSFINLNNDGYTDVMAGNAFGNFYFFKGNCAPPVVSVISNLSSPLICNSISNFELTATSNFANYSWSSNAGSATTNTVSVNTPTANTTYYVWSINNACVTMDSITVYVNPDISATKNTICLPGSASDTVFAYDYFNKGLVAYYPFNGNANDFSGNGYNAITTGVTLGLDRFGNTGACYQFSGASTYITCPPAVYFNGDFTISGWVSVSALGSWARLIDFGNGSTDNVLVALSYGTDNKIGTSVYNGSIASDAESQQVMSFNQWVHVLVTLKGNMRIVYYNGVAIDSMKTSFIPNNVIRNNCYIGLSNIAGDGGVTGSIDDIRIYNRSLSPSEVSNLYSYEISDETTPTTYNWSDGSTTPYIIVNPTMTSTYTVTETGVSPTSICGTYSVTNSITITVASPTVTAHATTDAVCAGNSVILTGSGGVTYTWTNGATDGAAITPTTTTQYSVTGSDASGCMDMDTITIQYHTLPNVTFDVNPSIMCSTSSNVILSGTPVGGTYSGTAVSGNIFSPPAAGAGTYTLSYAYTDANTCTNMDTAVVTVQICTGINSLTNADISIYPNPSNGLFSVSMPDFSDNTMIIIYNGIGQVVYTQRFNKAVETLNTNLPEGFYTLKLQSAESVSTQHIVVSK